jgi:hypothetical protein
MESNKELNSFSKRFQGKISKSGNDGNLYEVDTSNNKNLNIDKLNKQ